MKEALFGQRQYLDRPLETEPKVPYNKMQNNLASLQDKINDLQSKLRRTEIVEDDRTTVTPDVQPLSQQYPAYL